MTEKKIKVLVAKPGLDGHDRGAKVVAHALKEAGMEVIYTGLHKSIERIIETAKKEAVNVIGLSILSGAHLPLTQKLMEGIKREKMEDVLVMIGGVIPEGDVEKLKEMGVKGIFPGGTPFSELIEFIENNVKRQ
jgi:methylmalonyl-CoA mutase C-terminal domain/subunit